MCNTRIVYYFKLQSGRAKFIIRNNEIKVDMKKLMMDASKFTALDPIAIYRFERQLLTTCNISSTGCSYSIANAIKLEPVFVIALNYITVSQRCSFMLNSQKWYSPFEKKNIESMLKWKHLSHHQTQKRSNLPCFFWCKFHNLSSINMCLKFCTTTFEQLPIRWD